MLPNQWDIFSLFLVHDACLKRYFKNSCFVFHRGFQTLENNKSTRPTASCFHQFSRVWKPRWNTRTRFWYVTSNISRNAHRLKSGEYHSDYPPQFSWGIFSRVTRLDQSCASENIWQIIIHGITRETVRYLEYSNVIKNKKNEEFWRHDWSLQLYTQLQHLWN